MGAPRLRGDARARELIKTGDEIHVWQEDESPYRLIVAGLRSRGVVSGRVGIDDAARFFVFDGIRKLAPKLEYSGVQQVLKTGGVGSP
jgi:Xaa-Pro dipeptidase